jgi:hypothetical protein
LDERVQRKINRIGLLRQVEVDPQLFGQRVLQQTFDPDGLHLGQHCAPVALLLAVEWGRGGLVVLVDDLLADNIAVDRAVLDKQVTLPLVNIALGVVAATSVDLRLVAAGFAGNIFAGHRATSRPPALQPMLRDVCSSSSTENARLCDGVYSMFVTTCVTIACLSDRDAIELIIQVNTDPIAIVLHQMRSAD